MAVRVKKRLAVAVAVVVGVLLVRACAGTPAARDVGDECRRWDRGSGGVTVCDLNREIRGLSPSEEVELIAAQQAAQQAGMRVHTAVVDAIQLDSAGSGKRAARQVLQSVAPSTWTDDVLILVSTRKPHRKIEVVTGPVAKHRVRNRVCARIVDAMRSLLRQGRLGDALVTAVREVHAAIEAGDAADGEHVQAPGWVLACVAALLTCVAALVALCHFKERAFVKDLEALNRELSQPRRLSAEELAAKQRKRERKRERRRRTRAARWRRRRTLNDGRVEDPGVPEAESQTGEDPPPHTQPQDSTEQQPADSGGPAPASNNDVDDGGELNTDAQQSGAGEGETRRTEVHDSVAVEETAAWTLADVTARLEAVKARHGWAHKHYAVEVTAAGITWTRLQSSQGSSDGHSGCSYSAGSCGGASGGW